MLAKLKAILNQYRAEIVYLIFGVLTTLVNYLVYYPCFYYLQSAVVSNTIAWVAAVVFAYLTNKPFVFGSHDWSMATVGPELMKLFTDSDPVFLIYVHRSLELHRIFAAVWIFV